MHDQSLNFKNRVTSDIQLKAQNIFAEPLLEVLNDIDIIKRENHISKKSCDVLYNLYWIKRPWHMYCQCNGTNT